ncbi:MAG: hypothetical protein ACYC8T_04725 [Myxococcaceae bacterium]
MRRLALVLLLLAGPALARPWNGIEPGVSSRDDVVKKFGPPSKAVTSNGKEVLAYLQKQVIKGTSQAQFRVDVATRLVERIDVFPGPVIDREAIENSYGRVCPPGPQPVTPCYTKKVTADFQTYFLYSKLGLAIFFNEDLKTVRSFIFQPPKAAKKP